MSILQAPNILVIQLKVDWLYCFFVVVVVWISGELGFFNDGVLVEFGLQRFEGILGGKIDKAITFEEVLVLSSFMCKASQVCLVFLLN